VGERYSERHSSLKNWFQPGAVGKHPAFSSAQKLKAQNESNIKMSKELIPIEEVGQWEDFASQGNFRHLPSYAEVLRFNGLTGCWWTRDEPDEDQTNQLKLIADIGNVYHGYSKFEGRRIVDHHIVKAPAKAPSRKELGDLDEAQWPRNAEGEAKDPLSYAMYLPLTTEGCDAVFIFITSSMSGIRAVRDLAGDYALKLRENQKTERLPLVNLSKDRFKSKFGGKLFAPVFEILSWREIERDDGGMIANLPTPKALPAGKKAEPIPRKQLKKIAP
jgi:hypothetical protein